MQLTAGRVYRTADFKRWGANPTRTAERLVATGKIIRLRHGMYYRPLLSKWGTLPPTREEVLRAVLKGTPFVVTGSGPWNALRLGSTAVFPTPLVYNAKLSGEETVGALRFSFRRVRFPRRLTAEWFVIDLIQNRRMAGLDTETLAQHLGPALAEGRFDAGRLASVAIEYGTRETRAIVDEAIAAASCSPGAST